MREPPFDGMEPQAISQVCFGILALLKLINRILVSGDSLTLRITDVRTGHIDRVMTLIKAKRVP